MKTNHFVLKEDGNLYWVKDMPKEPSQKVESLPKGNLIVDDSSPRDVLRYTLQSAIDQSVLVFNASETRIKITKKHTDGNLLWGVKAGEIYSIECKVTDSEIGNLVKVTFPENSSHKVENSAPLSRHQENDQRPEDIWNAACQAQLELIAKTFSENGHKGDTNGDRVVFQAISETIKNHPKPVFNQAQEKTYTREEVQAILNLAAENASLWVETNINGTEFFEPVIFEEGTPTWQKVSVFKKSITETPIE